MNATFSKTLIRKIGSLGCLAFIAGLFFGCQTTINPRTSVILPFIKNSPDECYYLDEFMPVPDNVVQGRKGSVSVRYYTYNGAIYKNWQDKFIILSFYSKDDRCWSLFEEYYTVK